MLRVRGRVICLVRADSAQHAFARLEASLKAHAVWREEWRERLEVVLGDLARPLLGLKETAFAGLARSIDVILHNGAFLHWLHPYKTLAPANVLGTQEVRIQATTIFSSLLVLRHDGSMLCQRTTGVAPGLQQWTSAADAGARDEHHQRLRSHRAA